MLPPVFRALKASADVRAIVGEQSPRIWRHGWAPQGPIAEGASSGDSSIRDPYITWFVVAAEPQNNLSGTPPADRMPVQIDCWHPTDKGVEQLAIAVRAACEALAHQTGLVADNRDLATRLFRISLQFDWWVLRDE